MNANIWGRWVSRLFKKRRFDRQGRPFKRSLAFETLEDRVQPATISWTGGGTTNLWTNVLNWDLNRAPVAGDDLVFGALAPGSDRNTTNDIATLPTFNTITVSASGYILNATVPRTVLGGGLNVGSNLGNISITGDLQFFAPSGSLQQTITVDNGSNLVISGVIDGRNDGSEASQTLTKAGPGTVELTRDNTVYIGAITLANSGGVVVISHHNALGVGADGPTTVNVNSQLQLKNLASPVTERLILNGTGVADNGALLNTTGNNTWLGLITLDSSSSIGVAENTELNITAQITDTAGGHNLTKEGRGRLIFSRVGGNTYRGQTIIDDGILTIRDPISLGAGANALLPQNGTAQAATVVNFNSTTGEAGTLQFEFTSLSASDPNAILDPLTNAVIGFQVYNDLLVLNGPGYNPINPGNTGLGSLGALHNLSGDNIWSGDVTLGSLPPSTGFVGIGAAADTNLTVSGAVGDPNRQPELRKVLPGRVIFSNENTYDGGTRIEDGTLNIRDSRGLGNGLVRVVSGATLELEVDQGLDGTPQRTRGRNLGFDSVNFAGPGQEVFVPAPTGTFTLSFNGASTGTLNASSPTLAAQMQTALNGLATIGGVGGSVTVTQSGNIYRVIFGGTLLNADIPVMTAAGSANAQINAIYGLTVSNVMDGNEIEPDGGLEGFGFNNVGALRSVSGINTYSGNIFLAGLSDNNNGSIGVELDARPGHPQANTDYFQWGHGLTVTGTIADWDPPSLNALDQVITNSGFFSHLTKTGDGHLILPVANTYTGKTDILEGWVTVRHNNALGTKQPSQAPTNWEPTTVFDGAAVHLRPLTGAPTGLTIPNNFVLSGTGIDHPFDLIDHGGSLQNIEGNNRLTGIIQLNGTGSIGVEQVFPQGPLDDPSQLTVAGYIQNFGTTDSGLTKIGQHRLTMQGPGTFTGDVTVAEGVILVQHDSALGANPGTVTVEAGAALELGNSVTEQTGGLAHGRGIWGKTLVLHGTGNALFGSTPLTVLSDNSLANAPFNNPIVPTDNVWRGPIVLSEDTVFEVGPNSRLILAGPISDTSAGGSDITLVGGGVLELAAANTYRGTTFVNEGVLIVANGQALGDTVAGTEVANGASLQLAGSFTVAGESLILHGTGAGAVPNVPTGWFQVGPAPTAEGQTPGNENVTGRISATAVDPRDADVIYVGTAGGGAWKTIDGGLTWRPLFDALPEIQAVTVGTAGTFTLTFMGFTTAPINGSSPTLAADIQSALNALQSIGGKGGLVTVTKAANVFRVTFGGTLIGNDVQPMTASAGVGVAVVQQGRNPNFAMFVGSIVLDPQNPSTVYVGTGDPNSTTETFYGTGVYRSTDAGLTWSLVSSFSGVANPLYGQAISDMVIDPFTGTLYAASGDRQIPRNEKQVIDIFLVPGSTFTLSFTHPDANGVVVTQTTAPILIDPNDEITRQRIQAALNNASIMSTINIVPGNVTAVVTTIGPRIFQVEFTKNLANQNVAQLVANPGYPAIVMFSPVDGGAGVINGTNSGPGVWRFKGGEWFNLTGVVSTFRATTATGAAVPPASGANPTASADGVSQLVLTPGPDDDYRMQFPTQNAQWTDLALVYADTTNIQNVTFIPGAVLYAALGTTPGDADTLVAGSYLAGPLPVNSEAINNAVFWSQNTETSSTLAPGPWYVGDPGGSPYSDPPQFPTAPDSRPQGFPRGQFAQPVNNTNPPFYLPEIPQNGNIKVSAFTVPMVLGELDISNLLDFNDTILHASVSTPDGRLSAVYRTITGGQSWTVITPPANMLYGTGNFSHSILTLDQNTVILAGQGVNANGQSTIIMTTDAGANWVDISAGGPHAGIHHLTVDHLPNGQHRVLASTDGGLWRREVDGSWTNLNGNLAISLINGVSTNPTGITNIVAGSQANGTNVFSDSQTWERVDGYGGGQVAIDPNNVQTIYAVSHLTGTNAVLRKSTNGGQTWTTVLPIANPDAPLTVDAVNTARVLVGGHRIMESNNGGATWTNLLAPITVQDLAIANAQGAFVLDPNFLQVNDKGTNAYDADTIYVTNGFSIFVTKNHGQSWTNRTSNLTGLGSIIDLEVDPRNRDTVYAVRQAFGGGLVFRSTDAGLTWINITSDLPNVPVSKLVIDPRNGFLYAGTDEGVFSSINGGDAWNRFGVGMPNVQVKDLELNLITNTLVAGTYGRSVYQLFLDSRQTLITPVDAAVVALSGSSIWTGPVMLAGEPGTNRVTVGAYGTPNLPNTIPAASLNFVGPISDLTAGSNPILAKVGLGDVVFSGSNVYGGETLVEEGALIVDNAHALGANANGTTVVDGAVLELRSNLDAEPVFLNGDGLSFDGHYTGSLRNIAGDNTYVGPLTLVTDATIGVDSGSTLTIGTSPQLPGTGTVNGVQQLTKELTGTLVLASDNAGFSGATFVNQGALRVKNAGALGVGASGAQVLDGAQIQLQSDPGSPLVVDRPLAVSGTGIFGSGAILNVGGDNTWAGDITFDVLPNFSPDTFPVGAVVIAVSGADDTLTISGAIDQTAATVATGLTKIGAGELVLSAANSYSGATEILQGKLDIRHPGALGLRSGTASIQRVVILSQSKTGTLRLDFNGSFTTLNWVGGSPPTAIAVQNALNALPSIGGVGGSVAVTRIEIPTFTQDGPGAVGTGFLYTVTFGGTLTNTTLPLTASGQNGTGASASVAATGGIDTRVWNGATLELDSTDAPTPAGFTVSGRLLTATGAGVNGTGALRNGVGDNTWDGPINLTGNASIGADEDSSLTLSGGINAGGLIVTKVDPGTLVFPVDPDPNSQLLTVIAGGSVQVDGTLGDVQLAGGFLSGTGTVQAITAATGGGINPGDNHPAPGIGTLNGASAVLNGTSVFAVNLDGTSNDVLNLTGNINLGGATLGGTVTNVPIGGTFTIITTTGTVSGQLAGPATVPVQGGTNATIAFIGDTKFIVDYFPDHVILTRALADTVVGLTADPVKGVQQRAITFTANVAAAPPGSGVPTGTVTFTDLRTGALLGTAPVNSNGIAVLTKALGGPLGNHQVQASYSGDGNFDISSGTATVNIIANGTRASTVVPKSFSNPWITDSPIKLQATVQDKGPGTKVNPGGTIEFFDMTTQTLLGYAKLVVVGTGITRATLMTTFSSVGTHEIRMRYSGNATFAISRSFMNQVIVAEPSRTSSTTISEPVGQPDPSPFGQSLSFTATVTDTGGGTVTPNGTVTFTDDTTNEVLGIVSLTPSGTGQAQATLITSALSVGSHTITATYNGSLDFAIGIPSPPVTQTVVPATTTMNLTSTANPSKFGQTVTFRAQLTSSSGAIPAGQVFFKNAGVIIGSAFLDATGLAKFTTNGLPVGTHAFTAEYAGTTNFTASNIGSVSQEVQQSNSRLVLTSSTTSPNVHTTINVKIGAQEPGSAQVAKPTGQVTIFVDNVDRGTFDLVNGQTKLILPSGLSAGQHKFVVQYTGDGNFLARNFTVFLTYGSR